MVISLFKWLHTTLPVPVWSVTIAAIIVWWLLTWLFMQVLLSSRARPARVVILFQRAFFLVGAILIFNVTMVPVVLIAFHNMAVYTLLVCAIAAFLYLLRVRDKKEPALTKSYDQYRKKDDIFG